jgi:hypothetical protein
LKLNRPDRQLPAGPIEFGVLLDLTGDLAPKVSLDYDSPVRLTFFLEPRVHVSIRPQGANRIQLWFAAQAYVVDLPDDRLSAAQAAGPELDRCAGSKRRYIPFPATNAPVRRVAGHRIDPMCK